MNIHHQIDFVLRIVDSMTERAVKGGSNRFWIDGHLIKPAKVMDTFFVFSNVFSNPSKFHVYSQQNEGLLTWENPFYTSEIIPLALTVDRKVSPTDEIFIRALPSEMYPFTESPTGLKGSVKGAEGVRLFHTKSRNHYHLKGPVLNEKYIELAQSMDRRLEGKSFWFGSEKSLGEASGKIPAERDREPVRHVLKDDFGTYVVPPFDQSPSVDCDILEVIEVPVGKDGQFFMVINDLDGEQDLKGLELEMVQGQLIKKIKVNLEKGAIKDIGGDFKWE